MLLSSGPLSAVIENLGLEIIGAGMKAEPGWSKALGTISLGPYQQDPLLQVGC